MGCEGGVTVYDAEAIEAEFGGDVWERTGFGRVHCNPVVRLAGHRYLLGTFNTCGETYGDHVDSVATEFHWLDDAERDALIFETVQQLAAKKWVDWAWLLTDKSAEGLAFTARVACWAVEHAKVAQLETWT